MTNEQKISAIQTRIELLEARTGKDNKNIINKLKRKKESFRKSGLI